MAKGTVKERRRSAPGTTKVGPPLLLLGLGYLSVLVSLPLVTLDGIPTHVVGYCTGALVPILVIGIVRRVDLDRRQSPFYEPNRLVGPAIAVLGAVALVAAGLHVWPIATELAS